MAPEFSLPPAENLLGGLAVVLALIVGLGVFRQRLSPATTRIVLLGGVLTAGSLFSPMDWWPERVLVLTVLAVLVALPLYQQRRPILQYLYFCRFPLLFGLFLAGLPALGLWVAPALFRNLFVTGSLGIVLVTVLACLAAWVVLITAQIVAGGAEARFGVAWRTGSPAARPGSRKALLLLVLSGFLSLPTIVTVVILSSASLGRALLAALLGLVLATVLFYLTYLLGRYLAPPGTASASWDLLPLPFLRKLIDGLSEARVSWATHERQRIEGWFARQGPEMCDGYLDSSRRLRPGFVLASAFFLVTFLVYAVCYFLLHPGGLAYQPPALANVLFLIILLGWIFSALSFFLDRFRVPVIGLLASLTFLLYFINDIDHYYELSALPGSSQEVPATPATSGAQAREQVARKSAREIRGVLAKRQELWSLQHPDREPVLVAVAASGGGITASLWTAKVLAELQREFGPELSESIYGLSTVSGGSVGAMYFIDAFVRGRAPTEADLESVIENAGTSSLAATAWGLAYPDFWRGFSLQNPFRPHFDRAWAMEQVWKRTLRPANPKGVPTLNSWGADVRAGHRPAALFNATIAETGERLVLSPLRINPLPGGCVADDPGFEDCVSARTFTNLYQEKDMPVTTAARLSATFPFVSPITRARLRRGEPNGYHVADGGYYDNFGVVTLVEGLYRILHMPEDLPQQEARAAEPAASASEPLAPRKILIVEIRASDSRKVKEAEPRRGWVFGTAGPMLTLLNVWGSGQTSRNNLDLELLQKLASGMGFQIARATFPLATEAPLSWHLTDAEKEEIVSGWDWCAAVDGSKVQIGLATARKFLSADPEGPGWKLRPPQRTALPDGVSARQARKRCLGEAPPAAMGPQAKVPGRKAGL